MPLFRKINHYHTNSEKNEELKFKTVIKHRYIMNFLLLNPNKRINSILTPKKTG